MPSLPYQMMIGLAIVFAFPTIAVAQASSSQSGLNEGAGESVVTEGIAARAWEAPHPPVLPFSDVQGRRPLSGQHWTDTIEGGAPYGRIFVGGLAGWGVGALVGGGLGAMGGSDQTGTGVLIGGTVGAAAGASYANEHRGWWPLSGVLAGVAGITTLVPLAFMCWEGCSDRHGYALAGAVALTQSTTAALVEWVTGR